jgi:hypothetical protein
VTEKIRFTVANCGSVSGVRKIVVVMRNAW